MGCPLEPGMNPKLLYVGASAEFFVSHRLPLAEAARAAGYAPEVLTPAGPGTAAIEATGFPWHELQLDRAGTNALRDLGTIRQLVQAYRRIRPDIVHHIAIKPVLYGTLAARITGVPRVINAVSGLGYMFTSGRHARRLFATTLYRLMLRHPSMTVILQNQEDHAFFVENRLARPEEITIVRGSGVDLSAFQQAAPSSPPVVVHTSRMLADKGVNEFIEAARIVHRTHPDVRFLLVGGLDTANPSCLSEDALRSAQASGDVEWLGHRTDIPDILAGASIYCLASYREGLPKSLIEAAAAGLPLITTDTSGCREVVTDGLNGLLVPVADGAAIAAAVIRLLDDEALRRQLGAAARADAEARFGLPHIVQAQISLYSASDTVGSDEDTPRPIARALRPGGMSF
jgi:glycosyltransferase involved in cell wall biosynthesis